MDREINNIIVILDPNTGTEGAVNLYIPATEIPSGQVANVFYISESNTIDTFYLTVSEGVNNFLLNVVDQAEPQVKAVYTGVTALRDDTYLLDTAASIRESDVWTLPNV